MGRFGDWVGVGGGGCCADIRALPQCHLNPQPNPSSSFKTNGLVILGLLGTKSRNFILQNGQLSPELEGGFETRDKKFRTKVSNCHEDLNPWTLQLVPRFEQDSEICFWWQKVADQAIY